MGRYHSTIKSKPHYLLIATLSVLLISGLLYFYRQQPVEKTVEALELPKEQSTRSVDTPAAPNLNANPQNFLEPPAQAQTEDDMDSVNEEVIPLPPLNESDPSFKRDVTELSETLSEWLNTDQVITSYLNIFNDASQGQRQFKHMRFLKPTKPFAIRTDEQGLYIDPQSYRRYDELAETIDALNVQESLALYQKYRPLFQQAFTAFSYPEQYQLEDIFKKTAAIILDAPVIESRVYLIRPTVRYEFKDRQLEQLDPLQKQMIRMGPINTKKIQNKVRLLIEALVNQENH